MSEVEVNAVPVAATAAPTASPAQKLNAIQIVEREVIGFFKQKEQAIANLHAIDGAIQAGNLLLQKLKDEAAKGEAAAKAVIAEVEADIKNL